MLATSPCRLLSACALFFAFFAPAAGAGDPAAAARHADPPLVVEDLGIGAVTLSGPWQFHTGDNMAWASPDFNGSGWNRIDIGRPWGDQGFWSYYGFAWYRRRIDFEPSAGGPAEIGLYMPGLVGQYEVYWNGRLVGRSGPLPATNADSNSQPAVFFLHAAGNGVLAIRAWSPIPDTSVAGDFYGFNSAPAVGNAGTIELLKTVKAARIYQTGFLALIEIFTYGQLFLLSLLAWWRNRGQKLLFWSCLYFLSTFWYTFFNPAAPPLPILRGIGIGTYINSTFHSLEDIALWYLLLYLLDLDSVPALRRWTRALAWVTLLSAVCDEALFHVAWTPAQAPVFQILDFIFTAGFSVVGIYPLVLIVLGFRRPQDLSRRFVAVAAFLSEMFFVIHHTALQGMRFTHWTLSTAMEAPLFQVMGVDVHIPDLLSLMLVISIVYAVYRYSAEERSRRTLLEQEFQNARELQQVLIPESLPNIPGYALSSAYKPALEVGGDFFQIVPLDGGAAGANSTLVVLGDVSGKGLKAAMAVSLIVGAIRTQAEISGSPADLLAGLNRRLHGRLQGGFATAIAMRLDVDGRCTLATAGHPAPFLNGEEIGLPAALPLGLTLAAVYEETTIHLDESDGLVLYTDGVSEARNPAGELFGFERTRKISSQSADQIAKAAEQFGQEDDITVLTLTFTPAEVLHA